ncbi:MAG: hypothetical protein AB1649_09125 [Chloroflexota bacterium]
MRQNKKIVAALGIGAFACVLLGYFYVLPVINNVSENLAAYNTRVAYRDNYKLHTTPMPQDIARDICEKLEIELTSEHCKPNAVVYAPDFFDELKEYFLNLPEEERTYAIVQSKLGEYLQYCGEPQRDGSFDCRYDFIGDGKYSFFFFFDKNNYYYRIIANTGGS